MPQNKKFIERFFSVETLIAIAVAIISITFLVFKNEREFVAIIFVLSLVYVLYRLLFESFGQEKEKEDPEVTKIKKDFWRARKKTKKNKELLKNFLMMREEEQSK